MATPVTSGSDLPDGLNGRPRHHWRPSRERKTDVRRDGEEAATEGERGGEMRTLLTAGDFVRERMDHIIYLEDEKFETDN